MAKKQFNLLSLLGYAAFFLSLFVVFAYVTFPYQRLRDYLMAQVNGHQQGAVQGELRIGELAPAPLLGINLQDVQYRRFDATAPDKPPRELRLDSLQLNTSLLGLLLGTRSVDFVSQVGEGSVEGSVEQNDEELRVSAELASLDLQQVGLGSYFEFPVEGVASGEIDLNLLEDAAKSAGDVDLKISQLALGDGKAQVGVPGMREGFIVERVDAGTLKFRTQIKDGDATLKAFEAKGPDLTLKGEGDIRLASPAARSRLDLALQFKFSDNYKERDARTKALFELMGFRPELKRATTPDGALRFELKGFLQSPRVVPAGAASRTRPAGLK